MLTMRAPRRFSSSMIVAALCAVACGGSAPPVEAPTAEPAPDASAATPMANGADLVGSDDKSGSADGTTSDGGASEPTSEEPAATNKRPETRTMEVIRKLVMDNRKAARKCYENARLSSKDLQGNVVIHFVLDPEGKVKSADLNPERSTLKDPAVVDCVIGVIKGISFPKSSRAMETTANYPFNFTP
jgi:hypothetical protein